MTESTGAGEREDHQRGLGSVSVVAVLHAGGVGRRLMLSMGGGGKWGTGADGL